MLRPKILTPDENHRRMTEAPVARLIATLAAPTIVSMLVTSFYNLADTAFVSRLGTQASGAVGVVFSLMAIIQAIGFTFGMGSGNYNSRLLGAKQRDKADIVFSTIFFSAFTAGLALTVVGLSLLKPFMRMLGATETILPYAMDYAGVILIGAPLMTTSFVMNTNLRSEGNAFLGMRGIATGALLNVVLDPLFIFTFKMGIRGAAIATVLSQAVSFSILLYAFIGKQSNLHLRLRNVHLRWWIYQEVLRTGLPAFYRQGAASLASIFLNVSAAPFGDAALASMAIVNRVMMFLHSALIGFGQGFQPVAGFNWGAKRIDRLRKAYWFTLKTGIAAFIGLAVIGFSFAPLIMRLFIPTDPRVHEIGSLAMRLQCLAMPLQAVSVVTSMLFQSVGRGREASVTAMARHGLFFIPLVLVLPQVFGLLGLQMSQPVSDLLTFLLSLILGRSFLRWLQKMPGGMPDAPQGAKTEAFSES
jgi:putative MATE family efflux protein